MTNTIKIATYNISGAIKEKKRQYSRKPSARNAQRLALAKNNLDSLAEVVQRENISFLALQEVDVCYNGQETLHQAEYLAGKLSMNFCYQPHIDFNFLGRVCITTGLALLTKYQILSVEEIDFPQRYVSHHSNLQIIKRCFLGHKKALHCVLNITGKDITERKLHVINAHLTHDDDQQKELELRYLLNYARQINSAVPINQAGHAESVLLMGDLNTTPYRTRSSLPEEDGYYRTDHCMEILAEFKEREGNRFKYDPRLGDFRSVPEEVKEISTSLTGSREKKLDYLLLLSEHAALSPENVLDIRASDHKLVLAELSWV